MKVTSLNDVRKWLYTNRNSGYSHMIVVCDTFNYVDYPVYVKKNENINQYVIQCHQPKQMREIMEIYDYNMNLDSQLEEDRAYHIDVTDNPTKPNLTLIKGGKRI